MSWGALRPSKNEFDASKLEIDFEVLGGCEKKWGQCPHFPAIEAALGRLAECSALKVASALAEREETACCEANLPIPSRSVGALHLQIFVITLLQFF